MKKRLFEKRYLKLVLLFLGISISTTNCSDDNEIMPLPEQESNIIIKKLNYEDIITDKKVIQKINGKPRELKHLFDLDNYDPVIFIPKDSIVKKISIHDLKKYNAKDYNWLNKLTGKELDYFFHVDKTIKEYYLIEKRESKIFLYLRKVYFIQEID